MDIKEINRENYLILLFNIRSFDNPQNIIQKIPANICINKFKKFWESNTALLGFRDEQGNIVNWYEHPLYKGKKDPAIMDNSFREPSLDKINLTTNLSSVSNELAPFPSITRRTPSEPKTLFSLKEKEISSQPITIDELVQNICMKDKRFSIVGKQLISRSSLAIPDDELKRYSINIRNIKRSKADFMQIVLIDIKPENFDIQSRPEAACRQFDTQVI